ncbi:MAG: dienelactone hydrolase family protein [Acidimicrobiia bacterium]
MRTQEIKLETADGPMRVYEAAPDEDAAGAVIVIQEAFGVNDHIEDVTRRFAVTGYHAVAPALFHRTGGGTADYDSFDKVVEWMTALTDEGMLADVDATVAYLNSQGFDNAQIGTVGFCMGGRVTFLVAARRALGAAVGFYGGGIVTPRFPHLARLIDEAAELRTPWLGLFGDADTGIPVDDVEALRDALTTAPEANEIVRYPDAEHGFHCDHRPAYHPEAAADGWRRTLAWFDTHLG